MKEIRMVDLKTQYEKIKNEINTAIESVLDSTAFIKGPQVSQFEGNFAKYLDIRHVVACANGTDALQIALMGLGLERGDEVITPDFTFISTIEVIALLGLKPVIADVDSRTYNIDPVSVKRKISNKTKAIIPVHLFGQCADMDSIMSIAREHNLYVIEDTAQAIGAEYHFASGIMNKAGTMGNCGCTSFFPSKTLACYGDGGAVVTNDDQLADKMRVISNHGMKTRYYHDLIGVNSRLDTLQAAILSIKLKKLDQYNKARQSVAEFYDREFEGIDKIETPFRSTYTSHVFHQYTIKLKGLDRESFRQYLQSKGIPAMIYYPVPLHRQKAFAYLNCSDNDFPVTEELCKSVMSLPIHTELDEEQLTYITETVKEYIS